MRRHTLQYTTYLSSRLSIITGAILMILIAAQSLSGLYLALGVSVGPIFDINVLSVHRYLPSGIFGMAGIHVWRAFSSKLRFSNRGYVFMSGLILFVSLFLIVLSGCILSGGQLGLWVISISKSLLIKLSSVDCIGDMLASPADLVRRGMVVVYLVHFSGSFAVILVAYIHILVIHDVRGISSAAGDRVAESDGFINWAAIEDFIFGILLSAVWIPFMFVFDYEYVSSAEKYERAYENLTPEHIRPEIFLNLAFIILRAVDLFERISMLFVLNAVIICYLGDDYLRFKGYNNRYVLTKLICFVIVVYLFISYRSM